MSKQSPSVLIVEDEYLLLEAINKKLKVSGMNGIPYESGNEAIDFLRKTTEVPDLIWLDYQLRDMEGLEFINKLKTIEKCSRIPIIVVSNSASEAKVHNMLALGVRQYLLKAKYRLDEIIVMARDIIAEGDQNK